MNFEASIIIPAFNEVSTIKKVLTQINNEFSNSVEVLVIIDDHEDLTKKSFDELSFLPENYLLLVQNYGPGPANAIRFGISQARSECIVVAMADGSDDIRVARELINLVSRGVVIACASRYMSGGQQIGGPRLKKFISRNVGRVLCYVAGVGTHDPTNSFKAYSKSFVESVGIESRSGFEIGLELISKARRLRMPVAEIPTIWLDRTEGDSKFMLAKWAPKYLKWFINCFMPRLATNNSRRRTW